jgi:hypothetical protein
MLEAPSPSLGDLLAAGLEAVQASCWVLAFIHRYYSVCRDQGGGVPCEEYAYSRKAGAGEAETVLVVDGCSVS